MDAIGPTLDATALDGAERLADTASHARGQTVGRRRRRSAADGPAPPPDRSPAVHEWLTFVAGLLVLAARADGTAAARHVAPARSG